MTLIRYKILIYWRLTCFLSFALGGDVLLRFILGLLTFTMFGIIINSTKGILKFTALNKEHPLELFLPDTRLPTHTTIDGNTLAIPNSLSLRPAKIYLSCSHTLLMQPFYLIVTQLISIMSLLRMIFNSVVDRHLHYSPLIADQCYY